MPSRLFALLKTKGTKHITSSLSSLSEGQLFWDAEPSLLRGNMQNLLLLRLLRSHERHGAKLRDDPTSS